MSNAGYSSANRSMYWRMYSGHNCTNYVAYRMVKSGLPNVRPWSGSGNATNWGRAMADITDQTPSVGAVAWWSAYHYPAGSAGHVAYVEKVLSPTTIIVSQDSWGGDFSWARITKSGRGWPSGFVHFNDRQITNTAKPTVSGVAKVGSKLTTSAGKWSQSGLTVRYQWRANGSALPGATGRALALAADHLGKRISVTVSVSKPSFPTKSVTTSATSAVAPGTLANPSEPSVPGTPRVNVPLAASPGSWSPSPSSLSYQWLADGVPIRGRTSSTFTPTGHQLGKSLSLQVTAERSGYTTATSTVTTAPVLPGTLAKEAGPAITGTARVGSALTATAGSWSPRPTSVGYQWMAAGIPVTGADASTFSPTRRQLGKPLSLQVTVERLGYTTETSSVATPAVLPGTLTSEVSPTVSGTAKVGVPLTVDPGTWSPTPSSATYQWLVDGTPVSGATSDTFTPRASHVGKAVTVQLSLARAGYTTVASTLPAGTVRSGTLTAGTAPTLVGTVGLGEELGVRTGSASPRATPTVQWLRAGVPVPGATGSTYKITAKDLGHRVRARVTWTRDGYHFLRTSTAGSSVVKSDPVVRATQVAGRGKVRVTVHVTASKVRPVEGTVAFRSGGERIKLLPLRDGVVTTTLRLERGLRHVHYVFTGGDTVRRGQSDRTVRIG